MTIPKRNSLMVINIVLPLILGLFIYLTKAERTYLSDFLSAFQSGLPIINYPEIVRNYACDFMWAYSLSFCLRLSLGNTLKVKYNLSVITLTSTVAIVMEAIQLIQIVPGVFDPWDMLVELVAITIATSITLIIERRFNNYEET